MKLWVSFPHLALKGTKEFVTKLVLRGVLTHTALGFKTFKRDSVIVLDGVLNKGQDLWSFTEVSESWLAYGVQEENKTVPEKGAWHTEMGHHLAWLLGCCYQQDPAKGPQVHQRDGDLSQSLGIPSEPSSKGVLVFSAQHTEEVAQHTEGQRYGGSNNPIPVCTYTVTEPWGTYPKQPVHQEHIHHPPVKRRDEWVQGGTEILRCSWTARNPAVGNGTIASGGLNQLNTPEEKADNTSVKPQWIIEVLRQILYSIYEGRRSPVLFPCSSKIHVIFMPY